MDKKEFRKYVEEMLKSRGYRRKKSYFYKFVDDDYLVGFDLYASSHGKGYYLRFGVLYLPDEEKWPFCGAFDHAIQLFFPSVLSEKMNVELFPQAPYWGRCCFYERLESEQIDEVFRLNYELFVKPRLDKDYVLSLYRDDWRRMNALSSGGIIKICRLIGVNPFRVAEYLERDLNWKPEDG